MMRISSDIIAILMSGVCLPPYCVTVKQGWFTLYNLFEKEISASAYYRIINNFLAYKECGYT